MKACSTQDNSVEREFCKLPKRQKKNLSNEKASLMRRRENFVKACRRVSFQAYSNYRKRMLLSYMPSCLTGVCKHTKVKESIPNYAVESFKVEINNHMWLEAVDICHMSISPQYYLSDDILKGLVLIILNAHDSKEQAASYVIDKCQQMLFQNFNTHPPCLLNSERKNSVRDSYSHFLLSQMIFKIKNKDENKIVTETERGIVTSCIKRLQYELQKGNPGPILTKEDLKPNEHLDYVQCINFEKVIETFETLNKTERIMRLMAVLESVVELLQFDLAIWYFSSVTHGRRLKRSDKPLMRLVLWPNENIEINKNGLSLQIARLFVNMIHLNCPEDYIKTMTILLNITIETIYQCDLNFANDYPNLGKHVSAYATEFYEIIQGMPPDTIIRILEYMHPTFIRSKIGTMYLQKVLSIEGDCLFIILKKFLEESLWKNFPVSNRLIKTAPSVFPVPKKISHKLKYLQKKCLSAMCEEDSGENFCQLDYSKQETSVVHQEQMFHILYVSLDAYLDGFSIPDHRDTIHQMNLLEGNCIDNSENDVQCTVTETFVKTYKRTYEALKEITLLFDTLKDSDRMPPPDLISKMKNIGLFDSLQ